jgi:hypothetical protein
LEDLDAEVAWEIITENTKISAKESLSVILNCEA